MTGPEGSELVSVYAYPSYFTLKDGDDVNTTSIDFVSFEIIGTDLIAQAVENIIPQIISGGEEILCYGLFRWTIFDLSVPQQVCVFGFCFTPPFAGNEVTSAYGYRLVIYTRPVYVYPQVLGVRALTPALVLAIVAGILAIITLIVGIIAMTTGTIKWQDVKEYTHDIITAPGQNVKEALTLPLVAFGLALVATAVVLPLAVAKVEARVPIGGAQVTVGGEAGKRR
jgi:hypothetical protein